MVLSAYEAIGGARLRAPGKILCRAWPRRVAGVRALAGGGLLRVNVEMPPGRAGQAGVTCGARLAGATAGARLNPGLLGGRGWAQRAAARCHRLPPPATALQEMNIAYSWHEGIADYVRPCLAWLQANGSSDLRYLSSRLAVYSLAQLTMDRVYPGALPPAPPRPPAPPPPRDRPPAYRHPPGACAGVLSGVGAWRRWPCS